MLNPAPNQLTFAKYNKNPLFEKCMPVIIPDGYLKSIDEIYSLIKKFNKKHNTELQFGQIKMKHGILTIYLDYPDSKSYEDIYDSPVAIQYDTLISKIDNLILKTRKLCKVCGKKTSTIVINTEIVEKCFDHYYYE